MTGRMTTSPMTPWRRSPPAGFGEHRHGEPIQVAGGHGERGVDHPERARHLRGAARIQRLPRDDLDDAAEHVGGHGVVPLAAGIDEQRHPGPGGAGIGEIGAENSYPADRYVSSTAWAWW